MFILVNNIYKNNYYSYIYYINHKYYIKYMDIQQYYLNFLFIYLHNNIQIYYIKCCNHIFLRFLSLGYFINLDNYILYNNLRGSFY